MNLHCFLPYFRLNNKSMQILKILNPKCNHGIYEIKLKLYIFHI